MKSDDTDFPQEDDSNTDNNGNNEKMSEQFQSDADSKEETQDNEFSQEADNIISSKNGESKYDEKKMKRILANRRSARASYQRRKRMFSSLETTITSLRKENTDLVDENKKLRQQVMLLQQQLSLSLIPNNQITNNIGVGAGPMEMKSLALQQLAAEHLHQQQQQQLLQNHTQHQGLLQNHGKPQQLQDFQQHQLMQGKFSDEALPTNAAALHQQIQPNQDMDQVILEMMLKGKNPSEKPSDKSLPS